MTVSRTIFVSSACFSAALAIGYWLLSYEPAGTTLLVSMVIALSVVAFYMFFAERDARLSGDNRDASIADAAGENVGTYVTHAVAPFWIGVTVAVMGIGAIVSPAVVGFAFVVLLFLGALLIVRSR